MITSPHRVRRLQWQISTVALDQALLLRQHFCSLWQDELLSAITTAFNEVDFGDSRIEPLMEPTIHIPKLELHLCVTSLEELRDRLPNLIQQQLKVQLQPLEHQQLKPNAQSPSSSISLTSQQHTLATLLHYLHTGSLPWETTDQTALDITTKLQAVCQQQRSSLLFQLQHHPASRACYFRLLQLIPPIQWSELFTALGDRLPPTVRSVILPILTQLSHESTALTRYTQLNLAAVILFESLKSPTTGSLDHLLSEIASRLSPADRLTLSNLISSLPIVTIAPFLPTSLSPHLPIPPSPHLPTSPSQPESTVIPPQHTSESADNSPVPVTGSSLSPVPFLTPLGMESHLHLAGTPIASTAEFPLAIRDAGLLLISPFLPQLLEATGIKHPQHPTIPEAQLPHTAALLHYLVTGNDTLFEHELTLIKVLLGLTPDQSLLVAEGLLQPNDKTEIVALLQALIDYWGALKTTSIDGLRSSFLHRSGLLRERENGWWVKVESKPYDMLLNQLPWSISVVKLPWMQRPIYSEWQTP